MGVDEQHLEVGIQQFGERGMYTVPYPGKVVTRTMSSTSLSDSSNGVGGSFFSSDWDPLASLSQSVEFRASSMASHHQVSISSHGVPYPSNTSLLELGMPRHPCYGSGSFAEMVTSVGVSDFAQITDSMCPSDHPLTPEGGTKKNSQNSRKIADYGAEFRDDLHISGERGCLPHSPNEKKRKKAPGFGSGVTHSQLDSSQCVEAEQLNDASQETLEVLKDQDDKRQKTDKYTGGNFRGKATGKQAKGSSQNEQAPKQDYIHVRARRGQATNSHSLAERVRREKISQRMRFLQDLVPGCNKITGKALMLDEIINYVQSLQRQVEFLSMKLATVNPELNIDIERILSKEMQAGSSSILGFRSGISHSHPQIHIIPQVQVPAAIQHTESHLPVMSQIPSVWDGALQNVVQMGFISDPALENPGLNGTNWKPPSS